MASLDLIRVGEFVIKNGAKAVLLVWVFTLQLQVSRIEKKYSDCMNERVNDSLIHRYVNNAAILPKRIKIQKDEEQDI
jgi:hypothetical protein